MLGFKGLNRVFLQGIPSPRPSSLRIFKVTKRWVGESTPHTQDATTIYTPEVFPKKPYHTEIPHEGGKVDRTSLFTSTTVLWAFRLPTAFLDVFGPQKDGPWKAGNGTL